MLMLMLMLMLSPPLRGSYSKRWISLGCFRLEAAPPAISPGVAAPMLE
jgi:hypothetical protein